MEPFGPIAGVSHVTIRDQQLGMPAIGLWVKFAFFQDCKDAIWVSLRIKRSAGGLTRTTRASSSRTPTVFTSPIQTQNLHSLTLAHQQAPSTPVLLLMPNQSFWVASRRMCMTSNCETSSPPLVLSTWSRSCENHVLVNLSQLVLYDTC